MSRQVSTFQLRLPRGPHEAALERMAGHLSSVERHLHRVLEGAVREAGGNADRLRELRNALKSRFIAGHGITARHYNSILTALEGRHDSIRELTKLRIEKDAGKLKSLEKKIKAHEAVVKGYRKAAREAEARRQAGTRLTKALARKLEACEEAEKRAFALHHQKRRAQSLRARITAAHAELARPVPPVVFGSTALLRKRARIHPNDREGLAAWQRQWQAARHAQFLLVGSKDETSGCQSCVARVTAEGRISLQLRLPDALRGEDGSRHLHIEDLDLPEFGRAEILAALNAHARGAGEARVALTWRFLRDPDWRPGAFLSPWRVMVTLEVPVPDISRPSFVTPYDRKRAAEAAGITGAFSGAIGLDLNADHLAWARIDRHGNPCRADCGRIPLPLRGKTSAQREAIIGDAVKALVTTALRLDLPLVLEALDFRRKKAEMADRGTAAQNRMLASLAYSRIQSAIRRAAARAGVELVEVNPAWTSMIGRINYSRRYGLSVHLAAAVAIARRAARFSERINYVHGYRGRRNTLPTASECRRHVWRQWGLLRQDEAAARRRDKGRPSAGAMSSPSSYRERSREGGGRTLPRQHMSVSDASS